MVQPCEMSLRCLSDGLGKEHYDWHVWVSVQNHRGQTLCIIDASQHALKMVLGKFSIPASNGQCNHVDKAGRNVRRHKPPDAVESISCIAQVPDLHADYFFLRLGEPDSHK